MSGLNPAEMLRQHIVRNVRATFHEGDGDAQPRPLADDPLFVKDSPIRMVHADIVSMMIGGIRGLFLQMLHPHALQGVLDFSNYRTDMHGRLSRTAQFITDTTFGDRAMAMASIERVNRIHSKVSGTLPDGTPYSATDPRTLAWVHVAEATSFLAAYIRHVKPGMPADEQDEYYRQFAFVAHELGADPVPENRREADQVFGDVRRELKSSAEAREVAQFVASIRTPGTPAFLQKAIVSEAVALLPGFAREALGLDHRGLGAIPSRLVTSSAGRTLRWAFRQS